MRQWLLIIFGLITMVSIVSAVEIGQKFDQYRPLLSTGLEGWFFNTFIVHQDICFDIKTKDPYVYEVCVEYNETECIEWDTETIKYNQLSIQDFGLKRKDLTPLNITIVNSTRACAHIDEPLKDLWMKFGYNSVIIVGDTSYSGNSTNITQETGFAHLNVSHGNLKLYYPFDSNDSSTSFDYTSNGNDGTIVAGITLNSSGYIGNAYNFNEADCEMNIARDTSIEPAHITMSAWVRPNALPANNAYYEVINKPKSSHTAPYYSYRLGLFNNAGTQQIFMVAETNGAWTASDIFNTGTPIAAEWQMITGTWNGTDMALYHNGTLIGVQDNVDGAIRYYDEELHIGFRGGALHDEHFNGLIDEIMIFNRSLNGTEVSQLYNSTYPLFNHSGNHSFPTIDLGVNDTANVSVECQMNNATNLSFSFNSQPRCYFSNPDSAGLCNSTACAVGTPSATAVPELFFTSNAQNFYSPLVIGNFTIDGYSSGDAEDPNITLRYPTNGTTYIYAANTTFNCSVTDNLNIANVTLYGNWTGTWHANITNSSGVNNADYLFSRDVGIGDVIWNCYACDNFGNCAFSYRNWTFTQEYGQYNSDAVKIVRGIEWLRFLFG